MEMDIGHNDFTVDYNDGSLYEAIDLHNKHVDKILALGKMLFDQYGDEDPIIGAFCDVFNSMIGSAIYLCCEANSREEKPVWMTTEDFHVIEG